LQTAFYMMANFGYQFGAICNLPFVSEGLNSIIANAAFVGLICSAYRYDKVIWENRKMQGISTALL
jgi:cell division protein FtsW (lipid II flippase)